MPDENISISLELLRKMWRNYVMPFVLVLRQAGIKTSELKMGGVTHTNDMEGLKFSNWKEQLPFPDFVEQYLLEQNKKEAK
jgi:hypothetical protein